MTLPLVLLNRRRIGGFSPRAILAGSTALVWLDPSDLTTLFQDAAGTTPVTAPGQPVGLALDKSQGLVLGPELVTNGDFSNSSGWSVASGVAISGGFATFTAVASSSALFRSASVEVGKWYEITVVVTSFTSGVLRPRLFGGATNPRDITAAGTYTFRDQVTATNVNVGFATSGLTTCIVDSFSVRELPGFHATASGTSRPTYGVVPSRGRVNLLTYSNDFSLRAGVWAGVENAALTAGAANSPLGALSATSLVPNTTLTGVHRFRENTTRVGSSITYSIFAKANGYSRIGLRESNATGASAVFNVSNGTLVATRNAGNLSVGATSIVAFSDGWYRVSVTFTDAASTLQHIGVYVVSDAYVSGEIETATFAGDGTSSILVAGAQAETGSTATPYQRVVSAFDVTEAGVPSLSYLSFDGVDDFMQTPTITPNADKVQVFAGVRKLSDAARGVVVENGTLGAENADGSFNIEAPSAALNNYLLRSRGTTPALASGTVSAPSTNVVSGISDISGDRATIRINGTQVAQSTADQGTGNFLAYPLFIGRRGGTSLPFNGQLFGLIVRFSTANLDAGLISQTERWVAQKTPGVTIA